jgi:hypothetical protein
MNLFKSEDLNSWEGCSLLRLHTSNTTFWSQKKVGQLEDYLGAPGLVSTHESFKDPNHGTKLAMAEQDNVLHTTAFQPWFEKKKILLPWTQGGREAKLPTGFLNSCVLHRLHVTFTKLLPGLWEFTWHPPSWILTRGQNCDEEFRLPSSLPERQLVTVTQKTVSK